MTGCIVITLKAKEVTTSEDNNNLNSTFDPNISKPSSRSLLP